MPTGSPSGAAASAPARRDIDPVEIPKAVAVAGLGRMSCVWTMAFAFRYRLIGSEIVDMHQENFTNQMDGRSRLAKEPAHE